MWLLTINKPFLGTFAHCSIQSSECKVWFDGARKKRKRDFEGEKISKHVKALANRNLNEAKGCKTIHSDLSEASSLSSDEKIAEIEYSNSEETPISAFKRIRFDTGLQALGIEELVKLIELKRDHIPYSDVQVQELLQQLRSGQEELYELTEAETRQCMDGHPQAANIGRIDAVGPPTLDHPIVSQVLPVI